jgi:D-beta-D-heptose 7-phosphate kinase/D-beta-D-heptose 1-phosphate adenosyltransferase
MTSSLPETLQRQLHDWRSSGKRIVFTNGVFDLLHPGHLSQLETARSFGDVLIVGLNSDASVRMQSKGDDRPILPEAARLRMLEALRCVDAVVLFDDATPLALIEAISPHVLVKGADYSNLTVVGREHVEAYGGEVRLVDLLPGYSTSSIITRIREGK